MRVLITGQQGQLGAALAITLPHLGELVVTGWRELDFFDQNPLRLSWMCTSPI